MVLFGEPQKKSPVTPPGIDPRTVRLVAQCLNHYATPGPNLTSSVLGILVNNQPDALFRIFIYSFHLSTCFEHQVLIIRRSNCINTSSGMPVGREQEFPLDAYQAVTYTD